MNDSQHSLPTILTTEPGEGYELLDSGAGEKLERFGQHTLRRPDPQALWAKKLPAEVWNKNSAHFINSGRSGMWKIATPHGPDELPPWNLTLAGLTFGVSLSAFKHTGIFPEQSENWKWIIETVQRAISQKNNEKSGNRNEKEKISVLNLFGYTGGATLAAARGGAHVTHVDGSKVSVAKASENAKLSGLENAPIRWIIDDVMAFVKREIRRGNTYDAIIMDPPAYGHGPKKELWEIETHLPMLIAECKKILSPNPLFVIINGYASGYSAVAYKNNLEDLIGAAAGESDHAGQTEFGELTLGAKTGRLLPAGIFARWRAM
jgi:23S rRNA (cytosine1962-C5)-methyltransferase